MPKMLERADTVVVLNIGGDVFDKEKSFDPESNLEYALELLRKKISKQKNLPSTCPDIGLGEVETLDLLAPHVIGAATYLSAPDALAHMDPPTPWITWAMALWNARLNQNLLHQETSPFATKAEKLVIEWLTPFFGMDGGHMCSGSSVANLTAIWAARDLKNITEVVASQSSHLSIKKAAKILGLKYRQVETNQRGEIDPVKLGNLSSSCLVLTAGTTSRGAIDSLGLNKKTKWTHIDAAWAGPLRLSSRYSSLLDGVEFANSVSLSAHKWLFQPKDSALVLFKDTKTANSAISFGGGYLSSANIGIQGSRGASAIPLLATLIAFGKKGIIEMIEHSMDMSEILFSELSKEKNFCVLAAPQTGIVLFRLAIYDTEVFFKQLPKGMFSTCIYEDKVWIRSVCANPLADVSKIISSLKHVLHNFIAYENR